MEKITTTIKKLNSAHKYITKGFDLIKASIKLSDDGDTHFWRMQKAYVCLQQEIYKTLQTKDIDNQFKKIIKKFKK